MQGTVADKTLAPLNGLPVLCHSIRAFLASGCIDRFTIVYRDAAQKAELEDALRQIDLQGTPLDWVIGGDERQELRLQRTAHSSQRLAPTSSSTTVRALSYPPNPYKRSTPQCCAITPPCSLTP